MRVCDGGMMVVDVLVLYDFDCYVCGVSCCIDCVSCFCFCEFEVVLMFIYFVFVKWKVCG